MRHVEDAEMKEIIQAERLEVYQPQHKTSPRVYYKNIYRFTRCFIAGSVAVRLHGTEECAEGAKVTIFSAANEKMGECLTDNFGDFKFDNLQENSGRYTLRIANKSYDAKTIAVDLKQSLNVGTIFL
jgi:hypothetical protein